MVTPIPVAYHLTKMWKCSAEADRLVEQAKKGKPTAFLDLFQMHVRRIYTLSLRFTESVKEAENLTRDVFVDVFTNLDAVRDYDTFAKLLYRQAARTMIARRGTSHWSQANQH